MSNIDNEDLHRKTINEFKCFLNMETGYAEDPTDKPEEATAVAKRYLEKYPELKKVKESGSPMDILKRCEATKKVTPAAKAEPKITIEKPKNSHGGKRKGAGRKKKEPSIVMRVPESLVSLVQEMIEQHKADSE